MNKADDAATPEERITHGYITLDAVVTGVEQYVYEYGIELTIKVLTNIMDMRSAAIIYHFDSESSSRPEELLLLCRIGSCLRVKAELFSFGNDQLEFWFPKLSPLGESACETLRSELHQKEPGSLTEIQRVSPERLFPKALIPLLKTLIGTCCGKMFSERLLRDVREYMLADSNHWFSVRLEGQRGEVIDLIDQALNSMVTMVGSDKSLRELLVHVAAPASAELMCLVGVSERIRSIVGESPRIFVSTVVTPESAISVGLLGRE